jgi:hypothetical protein
VSRRAIWVPWDDQPQDAPVLDLEQPLLRDLHFAYVGGHNRDLVSGVNMTFGTANVRGVNGGLAGDFDGSSQYLGAAIPSVTLQEHTMFALVQGRSPGTDRRVFTFGSSSSNLPFTQIGTGDSNSNKLRLVWRNIDDTFPTSAQTSRDVFNRNAPVAAAQIVKWDGVSDYRAYGFVDGIADGNSGTVPYVTITVDRVSVGAMLRASPAVYFSGSVLLALAWRRPLSDDEIWYISQYPWSIFAPRRTYTHIPSGFPVLSDLRIAPGSKTSSGWTHRVTAS